MRSIGGTVGDTLWVSDPILRRTTYFLPTGALLRTMQWPSSIESAEGDFAPSFGVQPYFVEPHGTMLVVLSRGRRTELPAWWRPQQSGEVIVRVDGGGNLVGVLRALPPVDQSCIREFAVPGQSNGTTSVPFCAFQHRVITMGAGRVVEVGPVSGRGAPGEYQITASTLEGERIFSRRVSFEVTRLPRDVVDSAVKDLMSRPRPPEVRRALERAVGEMDFPEFYPPVSAVFVGGDGKAWIRGARQGQDRKWTVLSPTGSIVGVALLPDTFRAFHADAQRLWGTVRDADDVPSLIRYRIE
jgi:hypothetical protein